MHGRGTGTAGTFSWFRSGIRVISSVAYPININHAVVYQPLGVGISTGTSNMHCIIHGDLKLDVGRTGTFCSWTLLELARYIPGSSS